MHHGPRQESNNKRITNKQKKVITKKLPHDGVGLFEGLGSVRGVKQQPIDDIDLSEVLLSEHSISDSAHFHIYNKLCSFKIYFFIH